ncbi:helix-turn-helix domain-containing protein [Dactylosporangium sp. NPDC050688]|uniref:helix-turn-helix domain-containing protein n=1 Tax=Dactylosporangium sp. NPDC050688 TaxID=3157217 RepID=UPI0033FE4624
MSLVPLLRDMAADPAVVDELVEAARSCSAEVARLPAAENRRHIAVLVAAGLAAFERLADPSGHDFAEATRLGADRAAQGVPLSALLSAVQAGRTRTFEIAVGRGRAAGIRDQVLLEAALEFDRYAGALERHVIAGYRAAELELARGGRDERTALLRRLLLGTSGDVDARELARFRLHPGGRYHCLLSDVSDPGRARALEQRWSSYGGVFGVVEGRLAGLAPRPPEGVDAPVLVMVAPAAPPAQAHAGYALCVPALAAATRFGRQGVHTVADLAGETALTLQPRLAALLGGALLGALRPADEFHRELASTALAYLDHGQRLDRTAVALHVHPNTVRYRLRRLQEITGLPPADAEQHLTVLETLRYWWALRTWLDTHPPA